MEEQSSECECNYLGAVLRSSAATRMNRLAVIAAQGTHSFILQTLRKTVPSYAVETLRELRAALMEQEAGEVIALDIRGISHEDTALLAQCLAESSAAQGLVYVMSAAQFCLFEDVAFDFVCR
jgi:hypothetical protein